MKIEIRIVENNTNRLLVERVVDLVKQSDFSEHLKLAVEEAQGQEIEPFNWQVNIKHLT